MAGQYTPEELVNIGVYENANRGVSVLYGGYNSTTAATHTNGASRGRRPNRNGM